MKLKKYFLLICVFIFSLSSCGSFSKQQDSDSAKQDSTLTAQDSKSLILDGNTIRTRYKEPEDFKRVSVAPGSFEEFLQNLPLKPIDTLPKLYNGEIKQDSLMGFSSVVDMDIDSIDIQHSHESIIRLRAEYLYKTKQFDKISFIVKGNIPLDFNRWLQGYRIEASGNNLKLKKINQEIKMNQENFRAYLRDVFYYTDAESFRKNLRLIKDDDNNNEFGIGTIIMSNHAPYYTVIVVDMIEMTETHPYGYSEEPGVLVATGNSPAQEIAIVRGYDWLGIFPKNRGDNWKEDAGSIWISHTKGERQMQKQGGNIDIGLKSINNKKLFKFN